MFIKDFNEILYNSYFFYFLGLFIIVILNYVINMFLYKVLGGMVGEIFCCVLFFKFFIFIFGKGFVFIIVCFVVEWWFVLIKFWNY